MEIRKESQAQGRGKPDGRQLAAINAQARAELTEEQVYVFSLRLCDDRVDRDFERFDTQALPVLAKLFVGKTGVADHRWSSDAQVARIFETQVVREADCSYIKAWAYIRRGGRGDEVIADIEAGIKKEVSVGCAMGRSVCSVCGGDYGSCGHRKGEYYDGQLCCAVLKEPMDAYEFSFVAVPAQREAGVMKGLAASRTLKELAAEYGAMGEYRKLVQKGELGRRYRKELEDNVVRLCLSLDMGVTEPVLRSVASTAGDEALLALREALEKQAAARIPLFTQLPGGTGGDEALESGFLI